MSTPGHRLKLKPGTMCETHEHLQAVINIQGEKNSTGYEEMPMCKECYEAYLLNKDEPIVGICEWCKCGDQTLTLIRDADEGMYGTEYEVCSTCITKQNKEEQDPYESNQDNNDF